MVDRLGFQVDGLAEVLAELAALGTDAEDLKDAFTAIAAEATRIASAQAPRQSGRLAAGIRGSRAKSKAVVTAGGASVPYAGVINYGWAAHNIKPAGFLQTADQQMRPRALQMLEDEINRKIRERGLA